MQKFATSGGNPLANFDVRVVSRNLADGFVSEAEIKVFVDGLPDVAGKAEPLRAARGAHGESDYERGPSGGARAARASDDDEDDEDDDLDGDDVDDVDAKGSPSE